MLATKAYAVESPTADFKSFNIERREPKPHDVVIKILYCGICHSDIHQVKNDWGMASYPMVPGHEIVGEVTRIGNQVKKFKMGDIVGVGCFVDSCRKCENCQAGEEQFCDNHLSWTYAGTEQDQITPTFGGYSSQIVVDENYVLTIPKKLQNSLAEVAPLLCAGITTYSPLAHFSIGPGKKVGIMGLGGLGHMGIQFAAAMGAEVTVFSTSGAKEADAKHLGAKYFINTKDPKNLESRNNYFNLILDTISAPHDLNPYFNMLKKEGVIVLVGLPEKPLEIQAFSLVMKRRKLSGSLIGGIRETQTMLNYCAEKNITSNVEVIPIQKIAEAFQRTIQADVRYRFVIDMSTL